jgi:CheY-like chemotaxis protein
VASRIFKAEGAVVIAIDNGQTAIDYLKDNPNNIDLVLMDIQMPIMDGYQTTRLIRQLPQLINLPIVALSAGVFKSEIEQAKAVGINDFISKPFDVDIAVNLIATLADKSALAHNQFSGVDIVAALKIWGDVDSYKSYLLKFSQDCQPLKLMTSDTEAFAALIHKIKGTANMLGLIEINTIVHELDALIENNQDSTASFARLKIAIDAAQQFIYDYANPKPAEELTIKEFDAKIVLALLKLVLQTVENDSPDDLTQTLNELSDYLTQERINPLKTALDCFDFPLATAEVIRLANEYHLCLGTENV